jgi:hypothetical protein
MRSHLWFTFLSSLSLSVQLLSNFKALKLPGLASPLLQQKATLRISSTQVCFADVFSSVTCIAAFHISSQKLTAVSLQLATKDKSFSSQVWFDS